MKVNKSKEKNKKSHSSSNSKKSDPRPQIETSPTSGSIFPVVGIGASAGGLEAIEKIFSNMPSDSGMAFVIIRRL